MTNSRSSFLDGLLWYLETRNWAFEKIESCPIGSHVLDIKMYHYLYFSNLFGAVDLVVDYSNTVDEKADFDGKIRQDSENADDYRYARELRNAIIHRGLDPTAAGHGHNGVIFILCPSGVTDRKGDKSYTSSFKYTVQLAKCCNRLVNAAVLEYLDRHDFLNPHNARTSKENALEAIKNSTAMSKGTKALALQTIEDINFAQMAATIASHRVNRMKELLDHGAT